MRLGTTRDDIAANPKSAKAKAIQALAVAKKIEQSQKQQGRAWERIDNKTYRLTTIFKTNETK